MKETEIKEIEKYQFTDKDKDRVYNWAREIQQNIYPAFRNGKPVLLIPLPHDISDPTELHIGDWIYKVSDNQVAKLF